MNERQQSPNVVRSAFTLIEVLIAIALILALMGTLYGFLFDVLSSRRSVLDHVRQEAAGAALIKQLESDLMTCVVGDSVFGSGLTGDETRIRVLSRGVSANLASRGVEDSSAFTDLQIAEYRFDSRSNRLEGRRAPMRVASDLSAFSALEGDIYKLRLRYYDGEQWLTRFDSVASDRLPIAVEVALWYRPLPGNAEPGEVETSQDEELLGADEATLEAEVTGEDFDARFEAVDGRSPVPPDRTRVFLIPDAKANRTQLETTNDLTSGGAE